jgi:transposase
MRDQRSLSHSAQEKIRIQAVQAIGRGKSRTEVAEIFGVSDHAIYLWMRRYREGGIVGLRAKRKGRPPEPSKLKPLECAWVVRVITDKTPDQLKLPFYLWTQDAVRQLIEKKFRVKVSRWTVGRMLKKWGFTPQKPAKKSYFQKDAAVQKWLTQEYPLIKARALKEQAQIQWLDEMGARSDDQVGRTYGRKGQTPIVRISGNRFRCNMISTISNYGSLAFMMFTEKFTQDLFLTFLKKLVRRKKKKIFLILDSHPVHKGKKVKKWIKENQKKITVFFLPTYSPELNPTEYLNQDVKTNAVRRKRATNQTELIENISSFLTTKKQRPSKVKAYFKEKHVKYAA